MEPSLRWSRKWIHVPRLKKGRIKKSSTRRIGWYFLSASSEHLSTVNKFSQPDKEKRITAVSSLAFYLSPSFILFMCFQWLPEKHQASNPCWQPYYFTLMGTRTYSSKKHKHVKMEIWVCWRHCIWHSFGKTVAISMRYSLLPWHRTSVVCPQTTVHLCPCLPASVLLFWSRLP